MYMNRKNDTFMLNQNAPDSTGTLMLARPPASLHARAAPATAVDDVRVLKDRFFGATRQLDLAIGEAFLKLETTSREALTRVRVPVEAIQFLSSNP